MADRLFSYKGLTLQQLRSFCETARQGSLSAAAAKLGLAQPTVWKQVHALQQTLGVTLVEPHARGCRVTEGGQALLGLIAPSVANLDLDELRAHFAEALNQTDVHITLAAPPRVLAEDLPKCFAAFLPRWPRVRFTLHELHSEVVPAVVERGEATVALAANVEECGEHPLLTYEPIYDLDVILLTPRDHPLAQRRIVRPEDLQSYPLLNAWHAVRDPQVHGLMVKWGLYQIQPRRLEASYESVLRRCVEMGLGIALVEGLPHQGTPSILHERVMSEHFGQITIYLLRRAGVYQHPAVDAFVEEVRSLLSAGKTASGPGQLSPKKRSKSRR